MKIVFFGTPALAVPFLDAAGAKDEVLAVVTQGDRPAGRGLKLTPPPVKARALEKGLKVLQPERPSAAVEELKALEADLFLTVAYGRILKRDVLALPRLGCVNVHFSLLPKYRGAAPIAWCLARGEAETGVTTFWMDEGMDTGPILRQEKIQVEPDEDALSLARKLEKLGLSVLESSLELLRRGEAPKVPQAGEPTLAPILKKEDGHVHFGMPAMEFHNRVRGMRAWPRAVLVGPDGPRPGPALQILKTRFEPGDPSDLSPSGTVLKADREAGALVKCLSDAVWLREVQPEGRKAVSGWDYLNGLRLKAGQRLI